MRRRALLVLGVVALACCCWLPTALAQDEVAPGLTGGPAVSADMQQKRSHRAVPASSRNAMRQPCQVLCASTRLQTRMSRRTMQSCCH